MTPTSIIARSRRARTTLLTRLKRLPRPLARLGVVLGLLLATTIGTAGAASAAPIGQQTCRGDSHYTICLYITDDWQYGRPHYFKVHVGLDVTMTQQDAQNVIDGGGTFTSRIWGSDTFVDDNIQGVTLTSAWAQPNGLSVEWDRSIWGGYLDEDPEGVDEVYAKATVYDPRFGNRNFTSPQIEGFFWGGNLGP